MGGAKINLIVADGTSTPTTAANVAQRLITQNECVAILGAFASSLTIAISEVTERRGIPLLTMSFADQITGEQQSVDDVMTARAVAWDNHEARSRASTRPMSGGR